MPAATRTSICLLGFFLLMRSLALGADLFQWTDAAGVIHFTDSFNSVPESVRPSPSLIIRTGFFSPAAPLAVKQLSIEQPEAIMSEPACDSQLIANNSGPTLVPDAPQKTIVVVNSIAQRPIKPLPCLGGSCNHVFHHRFNDPRHVHQRPFGVGTPTSILGGQRSRR
jgi:Domain of unknown function (DUF4124)